jgi:hypothetical protein
MPLATDPIDVRIVTEKWSRLRLGLRGACAPAPVNIFGPHVGAKLSGDDVSAVIIQDRAEVIPTPSRNLEVGEVVLAMSSDTPCRPLLSGVNIACQAMDRRRLPASRNSFDQL